MKEHTSVMLDEVLAAAGDVRANVKRVAESSQGKRLKDEAADCFDIEIFIKVFF